MALTLSRYEFTQKLSESDHSVVYRGHRTADRVPVIIKVLREDTPTAEELAHFRQEYEITHSLAIDGVIRCYELERVQNRLALILEDFGAHSLATFLAAGPHDLGELLAIASRIAGALGAVHQRNVIHKDINPSNIVIHPETRDIKLIDFGLATVLPREDPVVRSPNLLAGTLAYMSPEQTGRMNRAMDYRTDLYSLGVTLYEMFTGERPFRSEDAMELVYSHIARQPEPPHLRRPDLPEAISRIVLKLLAKTAEERYQNAFGLKADLDECLASWRSAGTMGDFVPGRHDASDKFQLPQKLYGRDAESAALLQSFERISTGRAELLLVAGYSGIGKSTLVHEIHRPILRQQGYFISGKFEPLQRDIPYAPLVAAFRKLVRQILTESDDRIAQWRQHLGEALGANGAIISAATPELETLLGPQPLVSSLPPVESQNRLNTVFQAFVYTFATAQHPLVVFLDDLQWADGPSLKLLQRWLGDPTLHHLLVIGAYRDNEVTDTHPLLHTIEAIRKAGTTVQTVTLRPLDGNEVSRFIEDMLHCGPERAATFGALAFEKSGGNPFFLGQFLKALYDERLLDFDASAGVWRWDLDALQRRQITANVIDLLTTKLQKFPAREQHILRLAACIGHQVSLRTLATIYQGSAAELAAGLWEILQHGLLVPSGEAYHHLQPVNIEAAIEAAPNVTYTFQHDRIHQAAYALIDEHARGAIHLAIGRLLLESTPPEMQGERLFDILHQLDLGLQHITAPEERIAVARLNLRAGQRAKMAAAYEAARSYFDAGLRLLTDEAWDDFHDLAFTLHVEAMEAEYMNAEYDRAAAVAQVAIERARTVLEQAKVYETQALVHIARSEMAEAYRTSVRGLELLGLSLPPTPESASMDHFLAAMQKTQMALGGRSIDELAALPELTDPAKLAVLRLLGLLAAPSHVLNPLLILIISCEATAFCAQHGNSAHAAAAYADFSTVQASVLNNLQAANEYGDLALRLLERFDSRQERAKVLLIVHSYARVWKVPIRDTLEAMLEAFHCGVETGDLQYAAFAALTYGTTRYVVGESLDSWLKEQAGYLRAIARMGQRLSLRCALISRRVVLELVGRSEPELDILEPARDESFGGIGDAVSANLYHYWKGQLGYLFGDYQQALSAFETAEMFMFTGQGTSQVVLFNSYQALTLLALALSPETDEERRQQYLKKADDNLGRLRTWAEVVPANYLHHLKLVEAERARALGQPLAAMALYDEAIQAAAQYGYVQEEALAHERCGEFFLSLGRAKVGAAYLGEARYHYLLWGAQAKVARLEQRHPQLLLGRDPREPGRPPLTRSTSSSGATGMLLDLSSVMQAAQAISGEIVRDKLVATLMRILVENAGAERGLLLLERDGQLMIEAEMVARADAATLHHARPFDAQAPASHAILAYVARTRENVVLTDATRESRFATDPYVLEHRPKSVLCAPLVNQGRTIAIIYLENNLTAGAFTADRLEVLRLLLSQAALSIHNANLYAVLEDYNRTLEQKVEDRTRELRDKNEELGATLTQLRNTQKQLVAQEKLASLGALAAGIAHEIRNPLNFITNFADLSNYLVGELGERMAEQQAKLPADAAAGIDELLGSLRQNVGKIEEHGHRANKIVDNMLLHARSTTLEREPTDLNALVTESTQLAYHGMRSTDPEFTVSIRREYDPSVGILELAAADMSRVFINVVNNACYAVRQKKHQRGPAYAPEIVVRTKNLSDRVEVRIRDNGTGVPSEIVDKIFQPFFTTKPAGEGTGLGLSLSHDIVVQGHQGDMRVESVPGEFTELLITLPKYSAS